MKRTHYELTEGLEVIRPPAPRRPKKDYDKEGDPYSRFFPDGSSSVYWQLEHGKRKRRLRFYRSCHRNSSGYYLSWVARETSKDVWVKERWAYSKSRKVMDNRINRLYKTAKEREQNAFVRIQG